MVALECVPFRLVHCLSPAETLPLEGLQNTEKARVSLCPWGEGQTGTWYSQIRIPTCSGHQHYFSLLNSQVTQELGVDPGLSQRKEAVRHAP